MVIEANVKRMDAEAQLEEANKLVSADQVKSF